MKPPKVIWIAWSTGAILITIAVFAAGADDKTHGGLNPGKEKKVAFGSLAEAEQQAIRRELGDGRIEDISELFVDGQKVYEVDVVDNGTEIELRIAADGTLISKKVEGEDDKDEEDSKRTRRGEGGRGEFTKTFGLEKCTFSTVGRNEFFILEPGYQLTLEHSDGDETEQLIITVLDEMEPVGGVDTRVVEERELENGEVKEVSRNYFAFCNETSSIYYFGEETTKYEHGQPGVAKDSWRADAPGCGPGLMMPGLVLLGARYYQELAPDSAMDRAEIISLVERLATPAGAFDHCLRIEETNPLEGEREYKIYAPGIGLILDEDLKLTRFGQAQP